MEQALLAIVKKFPTHRETGRRMCCDVLVLDFFQENVCANNKKEPSETEVSRHKEIRPI